MNINDIKLEEKELRKRYIHLCERLEDDTYKDSIGVQNTQLLIMQKKSMELYLHALKSRIEALTKINYVKE